MTSPKKNWLQVHFYYFREVSDESFFRKKEMAWTSEMNLSAPTPVLHQDSANKEVKVVLHKRLAF